MALGRSAIYRFPDWSLYRGYFYPGPSPRDSHKKSRLWKCRSLLWREQDTLSDQAGYAWESSEADGEGNCQSCSGLNS